MSKKRNLIAAQLLLTLHIASCYAATPLSIESFPRNFSRILADFDSTDALMQYLAPLTFGAQPGPCPTRQEECFTDWDDVPQYVKNIQVSGFGALGSLIERGKFGLWELTCSNIELDSLSFIDGGYVVTGGTKREQKTRIILDDLALNCFGRFRYEDLRVRIGIFPINVGSSDSFTFSFDKSQMLGQGDGISIELNTRFYSPDFDASIPESFDFIGFDGQGEGNIGEPGGPCNLDISQGFDLSLEGGGFLINGLIDILIALVKGLLEGIACSVMIQLAYIADTNKQEKGGLNLALEDVYTTVTGYVADGLRTTEDFQDAENYLLQELGSQIEPEKAINFATDEFFEGVSFGLNNILGGPSTNPSYDLVINEAVDLLLNSTTGIFEILDIKSYFSLEDYPSTQFLAAASGISATLKGITLGGLNTFTTVQLLDNGYGNPNITPEERFQYTLQSAVSLTSLHIDLKTSIQFLPGEWVTSPAQPLPSEEVDFDLSLGFNNLQLSAATFLLLQPTLLNSVQVGQIFGDDQGFNDILQCVGRIVDHLNLTGITVSFAGFDSPSVSATSSLGDLIQESLVVFNNLGTGGLDVQAPFIVDNGIRPRINDYLEGLLIDPDASCSPYQPRQYEPAAFQLANGLTVGALSTVISNVIGGDPITDSDADINSIINTYLRYYLIDSDDALGREIQFRNPQRGTWILDQEIALGVQINSVDPPDFTNLTISGPVISNLDSIGQLLVNQVLVGPSEFDPYAAEVIMQWGYYEGAKPVEKVRFELPIKIASRVDGVVTADEDFTISLDVAIDVSFTLAAEIDKDKTFRSLIGDLSENLACVFAVLNSKELRSLSLAVQSFQFELTENKPFSTSTSLGQNLAELKQEIIDNPEFIEFVLNYFLDSVETETIALVNKDFDPAYEIGSCVDAPSPLGNTSFAVGLPIPNLANVNKVVNEGTTPQPNPRGIDPDVFEEGLVPPGGSVFDVTAARNGFVKIVSDTFKAEPVRNLIVDLANTTVNPERQSIFDPIIEALRLEEDNSVSLVLDIGNLADINFAPEVDSFFKDLKVTFLPLVISNVEKFDDITIIQPYSANGKDAKYTTTSTFQYGPNPLSVTFGVEIQVAGEVVNRSDIPIVKETINSTVVISQVGIELMTTIAVDQDALRLIDIGDLLQFDPVSQTFSIRDEGINCKLPQAVFPGGFSLPQLQVLVDDENVSPPATTVDGTLFTPALLGVVDSFVQILVDTFSKQIPNISQGPFREFINTLAADYLSEVSSRECQSYVLPDFSTILPLKNIFNFAQSPFSSSLASFIQGDFLNTASPFYINDILKSSAVVATGLGKTDILDNFNLEYLGQDLGHASIAIGEFQLDDLGTASGARITNLQLLDNAPFGTDFPKRTRNVIKFSGDAKSSFRFAYTFDGLFVEQSSTKDNRRLLFQNEPFLESIDEEAVYNDLEVGLSIKNLEILLDIDIGLDVRALLELSAGNLLDLYSTPSEVPCYLAVFDFGGLSPVTWLVNFTEVSLSVQCRSVCSSEILKPLEIGGGVETPEDVNNALTAALATLLRLSQNIVTGPNVQRSLDLAISTAREQCIAIDFTNFTFPEAPEDTEAAFFMFLAGIGGVFLAISGFALCVPRHLRVKQVLVREAKKLNKYGYIKQRLLPLAYHPGLSKLTRILVPCGIACSAIFFISANFFAIGATVAVKISLFGDTTKPISIISFTLENSIDDAWNSGAYPLAIIIAVAAGGWPYTKLILLLFCWFAPTTILKAKTRGRLAEILDSLGKVSLIDAYVLILLQVAFRFYITSTTLQQLSFLPEDLLVVDVVVRPGYGIYGFVLGTMSSLAINHVIVYFHRKAVNNDEQQENAVKGYVDTSKLKTRSNKLSTHRFFVSDDNFSYGYSRGVQVMAISLLSISTLLVIVGSVLPLLTFHFSGIAGLFIGLIDTESSSTTHTAFSIISAIADGADNDFGTQIGILFLQVVYIAFVALTPLLLVTLLALLLFKRMTLEAQKRIYFAAEVVAAWEALFILIVSCLAAVFQIDLLADFIAKSATGNACTFLQDQLVIFGIDEDNAKCIDVIASIEPTGYILIIGSVFVIVTTIVLFRLIHTAIEDREIKSKYNKARELGTEAQAQEIKERAHHPMNHGGCILGPLIRHAVVRYPKRRYRNSAERRPPRSRQSKDQTESVSSNNPMFENVDSEAQNSSIDDSITHSPLAQLPQPPRDAVNQRNRADSIEV